MSDSDKDPHAPNRLRSYLQIHSTAMAHHRKSGFVVSHDVSYDDLGDGFPTIVGNIQCLGSLYINVDKRLRTWQQDGETWVETVQYAYNCVLAKVGPLWRYNSPHEHRPVHHIHEHDVLNGDATGTIREITRQEWPSLSRVILRLEDWYYSNIDELTRRGLA